MAPSTEVMIGDPAGQHVAIRPVGRSLPGLFDPADGARIECEIQIAAGSFRGAFRADLRSEEFSLFLEELTGFGRSLLDAARFSTMERQIGLTVARDGQGQLRLDGEAADAAEGGNRLRFGFDIDQAALPQIGAALKNFLAAFPVAHAPEV